jgi:hypothetical protein
MAVCNVPPLVQSLCPIDKISSLPPVVSLPLNLPPSPAALFIQVDVTFQNLDSSEISLTDVSHYFDSDPTKLVQSLRTDGKSPSAYIADTTTANAQVSLPPAAL